MNLSITALKPLSGSIVLPGDKSLSHRAALFAALAEGTSTVNRFLVSGVTRAMLNSITALGIEWRLEGDSLTVVGKGLHGFTAPAAPLDCGNSATTIRMLAGALAASGTACVLDGSAGLRSRPMNRIIDPLRQMNVPITSDSGCAPLTLTSRTPDNKLAAIQYTLPIASAQVKSCLILAALSADAATILQEPGPSRDHTERMLAAMGAAITVEEPYTVKIEPLAQPLAPLAITLPGDISSAAFMLVAAAIVPGSRITIRDVGVNPTRTGILDALREMGAVITITNQRVSCGEQVADITLTAAPLKAINVSGESVVRMIDEFPAFAVAAAYAEGTTMVREAEELRHKESDRITTLCNELKKLGVVLEEFPDGFAVTGGTVQGGSCAAHGDHRLAMSLALAGLQSPAPVVVQDAEILNESFPAFTANLVRLGCEAGEA
ncbi:MAG: 3-phosphoshikimate 1-carboxyvinyltransferase [Kiritimatiellae bacterium]|nr:3-phosphoshikimate 1-carboxyvinyltransferase [Kiritimatiellia bacterium]